MQCNIHASRNHALHGVSLHAVRCFHCMLFIASFNFIQLGRCPECLVVRSQAKLSRAAYSNLFGSVSSELTWQCNLVSYPMLGMSSLSTYEFLLRLGVLRCPHSTDSICVYQATHTKQTRNSYLQVLPFVRANVAIWPDEEEVSSIKMQSIDDCKMQYRK